MRPYLLPRLMPKDSSRIGSGGGPGEPEDAAQLTVPSVVGAGGARGCSSADHPIGGLIQGNSVPPLIGTTLNNDIGHKNNVVRVRVPIKAVSILIHYVSDA